MEYSIRHSRADQVFAVNLIHAALEEDGRGDRIADLLLARIDGLSDTEQVASTLAVILELTIAGVKLASALIALGLPADKVLDLDRVTPTA
jgi:hypothetical protein